jgi:hypothetical protein
VIAHLWWWIEVHTGTTNEPGPYYGYWSGFGSVFPWSLGIIAAIIGAARSKNCHERHCWRLAHHTTANGHRLCKVHIGKPTAELTLHDIHPDHQ